MLQIISPTTPLTYAEAPVSPARQKLPAHLQKYVVEQNYARYTPEDQAVWRFIMRQLKSFLSKHAHSCYVEGLERTGISVEEIPRIDEMDQYLSQFGWGAVPVSGFIPPAAFMEFQSLGILPIAADIRSIDHLTYTPAPDIVHEASGHAPILIHPEFAAYLKKYAEVARHAIITRQDMSQYEAIRRLSDTKENPTSSENEIAAAEAELIRVNQNLTSVSEAGWLSRMNWWTAEYGLIGSLEKPLIYGAGLLSSLGESREYLSKKVRKVPLSIECIEIGYDITEPQPQLFVTPNFSALSDVLEQLADRMAFRLGGIVGLQRACQAETVTCVVLDSGLQISGRLESFKTQKENIDFLRFIGPVALSVGNRELPGHSRRSHAQGFSSPLGRLEGFDKPLSLATDQELADLGLQSGHTVNLKFCSGYEINAQVIAWSRVDNRLVLIHFDKATVRNGDQVLFDPAWGRFDLAIGERVNSVFGGPADRLSYGETEDFSSTQIPARVPTPEAIQRYTFYNDLRQFRNNEEKNADAIWLNLKQRYFKDFSSLWLPAIELIELIQLKNLKNHQDDVAQLTEHLQTLHNNDTTKECIREGLRLAVLDL